LNVINRHVSCPAGLKVKDKGHSIGPTVEEGRKRLDGCMEDCGAKEGWLEIFDRTPNENWDDRLYRRTVQAGGNAAIHVAGC
jgi:hypothetical protein